jgi:hypothetical protein
MRRRAFLGSLGIGAAGLVATSDFDWDRLLWRPKPIITVPALPGRADVRLLFAGGAQHVWRNVSVEHPGSLRFGGDDWKNLTVQRAYCDLTVCGRNVNVDLPWSGAREFTLHAGNTLTLQFGGPLVTLV